MNETLNENLEILENNNNIFDLCSSRKLLPSDILSVRVKQPNENAMLKNSPPFRPGGRASRQLVKAIEMSLADKTVSSDIDGNEPQFVIYMGENPCFAKLILRTAGSVLIEPMHPDPVDNFILQPWNGHVKIVEGNDVYQVQMRREQNGWKVTDSLRLRGILSTFLSKYKLSSLPSNLGNVKCLNNTYDNSGPSDPLDMMSLDDGSDDCNSTESSLFSMLKNNSSSLKDNFNYPTNQCSQNVATKPEQTCFSPTSSDRLMSRQLSNENDNNKYRRNSIKFSHQPFKSTIIRTPSPQPHVVNNSHSLSATTVALESPPVMKSDELHQGMLAVKRRNTFNYSKNDVSNFKNIDDNKNYITTNEAFHVNNRQSPSPMSHQNCTEFMVDTDTNIILTNPTITQQQQQQSNYSTDSPMSSITPNEYQHDPIPISSDISNQSDSTVHISNHSTITITTIPTIEQPDRLPTYKFDTENSPNSAVISYLPTATIESSVIIQNINYPPQVVEISDITIDNKVMTDSKLTHEVSVDEVLVLPPLTLIDDSSEVNNDQYNDNPNISVYSSLKIVGDNNNNEMKILEKPLDCLDGSNNIISTVIAGTTTTSTDEVDDMKSFYGVIDPLNSSIITTLTTNDLSLNMMSETYEDYQRMRMISTTTTTTTTTDNKDINNLPITTINELNEGNDDLLTTPNTDRVLNSILVRDDDNDNTGGIGKKRKRKLDIDFNISPSSYSSDESAGQMPPRPPRASNMRTHSDKKLSVTCNGSPSPSSLLSSSSSVSTLSAGISLPPRPLSSKKKGVKGLESVTTTTTTTEVATKNSVNNSVNNGRSSRELSEPESESTAEPAVRSSSRKRSSISPMQRDAIFGQWVSRYQSASTGSWQL